MPASLRALLAEGCAIDASTIVAQRRLAPISLR